MPTHVTILEPGDYTLLDRQSFLDYIEHYPKAVFQNIEPGAYHLRDEDSDLDILVPVMSGELYVVSGQVNHDFFTLQGITECFQCPKHIHIGDLIIDLEERELFEETEYWQRQLLMTLMSAATQFSIATDYVREGHADDAELAISTADDFITDIQDECPAVIDFEHGMKEFNEVRENLVQELTRRQQDGWPPAQQLLEIVATTYDKVKEFRQHDFDEDEAVKQVTQAVMTMHAHSELPMMQESTASRYDAVVNDIPQRLRKTVLAKVHLDLEEQANRN